VRIREKICLGIASLALVGAFIFAYQIRRLDVRDSQQQLEIQRILAGANNIARLEAASLQSATHRDQIFVALLAASLALFGLIVFGIVAANASVIERRPAPTADPETQGPVPQLHAQLLRLQKLESLNTLGGMTAHDLNNLLMGIVANTSLMMDEAPAESPILNLGENVLTATEQAGQLTKHIVAYSGAAKFAVEPVDLGNQVNEVSSLAKASLPKGVRLSLNLSPDLPIISADPRQIQQLLMNLVQNGAEAAGLKGAVTISASMQTIADSQPTENLAGDALPAGHYLVLEVKDTGPGMDAATKAEMFDPFSSSQFSDRGLGLAAVLGIVRRHRAGISMVSDQNGTTFKVFFPIKPESAGSRGIESRRSALA
jgi:signal transduction histidine kinase